MTSPTFKVIIDQELENELDSHSSPMDGIFAIDQLHLGLPKLHTEGRRNRTKKDLRLYSGWFDWADVGFSYIQVESRLHIVEIWTGCESASRWKSAHVVFGNEEYGDSGHARIIQVPDNEDN
jgi:hypothetical protein